MGKDYRRLRKIIFNEELNKKYDDVREDNWYWIIEGWGRKLKMLIEISIGGMMRRERKKEINKKWGKLESDWTRVKGIHRKIMERKKLIKNCK